MSLAFNSDLRQQIIIKVLLNFKKYLILRLFEQIIS